MTSPVPAPSDGDRTPDATPRKRRRGIRNLQSEIPKTTPSRRDLEVYEQAVLLGRRQEEVGRQFHISATRVRQLIRRVRLWKSTVPWHFEGLTSQQQINLATHETRQWLQLILNQALTGLDASDQSATRAPKSGFLRIALDAVSRWGRIGGAGEQWQQWLAEMRAAGQASADKTLDGQSHDVAGQSPPSMGPCGKKIPPENRPPRRTALPTMPCDSRSARKSLPPVGEKK